MVYSAIIRFGRLLKKISLKLFNQGVLVGENTVIDYRTVIINKQSVIKVGRNVYLRSNAKGYQAGMPFPTTLLADVKGALIEIGDNCRVNGAYIHAQKSIKIGSNCVIASGVNILDTNGHELYSNDRTINRDLPEGVIIGNNVWIGLNAVILKGTVIGDNAVVSAGSIVKGTFEPNSLIVGNPAKTVKILNIPQA
jgi:acetyltransferase-like isoleucine patch superfamily enzyme